MDKNIAKNLSFQEFEQELNLELKQELNKYNMPLDKVYQKYIKAIEEEDFDIGVEFEDANTYVKNLITDYIEGLLYKTYKSYELDWE